jgi:four helix bundle protein
MTNDQFPMTNLGGGDINGRKRVQRREDGPGSEPPFDIYERTFRFAVRVIRFVRGFPRTLEAMEVGRQLIRAGCGVGSNMEEANGAESRRDFIHKVGIALKECREARYWLRVCVATEIGDSQEGKALWREGDELVRILGSIIRRTQANPSASERA